MVGNKNAGSRKPTSAETKAVVAKKQSAVGEVKAQKLLDPLAKEINVRLEKAEKMDGQANDHRLAASLRLGDAKIRCEELNVNFKKWVGSNIKWSYETARKLAAIGQAQNPAAALEDLRERTAIQMRESRKRAKASASQSSGKRVSAPAEGSDPRDVAAEAMAVMNDEEVLHVVKKRLPAIGQPSKEGSLDAAVFAFDALNAGDKVRLLAHAAAVTSAEVVLFGEDIEAAVKKLSVNGSEKRRGRQRKAKSEQVVAA